MRHKRIKRDHLLSGDIKVFHKSFETRDEAIRFAKMSQRSLYNSRIYVRKNRVTISMYFSSDSWFLAFLGMTTLAEKYMGGAPEYMIATMSAMSRSSRNRKTSFMRKGSQRVDQRGVIDEFVKTCRQYEACIGKF